jgi:hypothetical protein
LRGMLRGLITFLVGAGLVGLVYTMRPDVPIGPATSRPEQPATPGRLASTSTGRPISTDPAPDAFVGNTVEPISSNLHKATIRPGRSKRLDANGLRAELAREVRSVGWGNSYAVRLLTSSGEPLVASEIVLVARRGDGTVENVAMGALPERGVYRATLATGRSAPISLQVRVRHGEQSVKIPVSR